MRVLVLGGSGHIGRRLMEKLQETGWAQPTGSSRGPGRSSMSSGWMQIDTRDEAALTAALQGFDAVVNCVAGDGQSISQGMRCLVQAALAAKNPTPPRIIHLSTMSVYGSVEATVTENMPLHADLGWYGRAKCEAEGHLRDFVNRGGQALVLRPGCVYGPGSELWVGRIARWLQAGRLGDLGVAGDGWSNLVHVDDVCHAILAALRLPIDKGEMPAFNLSAPDSPRWNEYFVDMGLAIGATPVWRIGQRQLKLDAWLAGPPLKVFEIAMKRLGKPLAGLPDPMPPGLLRLWSQHIHLDAARASRQLEMAWTPYAAGVQSSAAWFNGRDPVRPAMGGDAICAR